MVPPVTGAQNTTPIGVVVRTFTTLGISQTLLAVLTRLSFVTPTPIQEKSIPVALEGKDIIGIAQTGTGKTLAFGIPMLERILASLKTEKKMKGLVLLPTRELAIQVQEALYRIGGPLGVKSVVLIGGESMHLQKQDLRRNPDIFIATPGRLLDLLEQRALDLNQVGALVLDEADHMFDMGFAPQITKILKMVPKVRQTMLFSATMPPEIVKLALQHMTLPLRIEVAPAGTSAEKVEQEIVVVKREAKFHLLEKILKEHAGTILVFARTKHGARKISQGLNIVGYRAAEIHGNRSLGQRKEALSGFKSGKYRILVATDIAARGIDVNDIEVVVNYDLPDNIQDYVHRIGRTARAGKQGKAISFAAPDQLRDVQDIERLIRKRLPQTRHESPAGFKAPVVPFVQDEPRGGSRSRGFAPRGGSFSRSPRPSSRPYSSSSSSSSPRSGSGGGYYHVRSGQGASRPQRPPFRGGTSGGSRPSGNTGSSNFPKN